MIIDTGTDFIQLSEHLLWKDDGSSPLVVIVMTGDLELYFVETVDEHFSGCLDDYHDAILRAVDQDYARYFAIAHESPSLTPEKLDHDANDRLKAAAAKRGLYLISELYVDRDGWCSTGPMHQFKHYFRDDLPKLASRRPAHFAMTRMAGGAEIEPLDDSFYQQFSYELEAPAPTR